MSMATRPRVAFFDFSGCEGCQLTVIDALQTNPELLDAVEIVQFREAMSERDDTYQIAFVEGSYTRPMDAERLRRIRAQAEIVVALGACAHLGGVNAVRNRQSTAAVRRYVYGENGLQPESGKALPVSTVIEVDAVIPGCPISGGEFVRAVKSLLMGRLPALPDYPVCRECKYYENECLFLHAVPCLGAVTQGGCGAVCPSYGLGCEGCRGLVADPNLEWLRNAALAHGIGADDLEAATRLFLSHALHEDEVKSHA